MNFSLAHFVSQQSGPPRVAVLYQAVDPPVINGVRKPPKPGGYQDSGADIAYVLRTNGTDVVTPTDSPDARDDRSWCFPDTEEGILAAIRRGANHLWCNTILFSTHPLQTSASLDKYEDMLAIVGQPPNLVDQYDDKDFVNSMLRHDESLTLPTSWLVESSDDADLQILRYPVVGKPVRGRGSHGVKVCHNLAELQLHLKEILSESPRVLIEEYLSGPEATITIMPPSVDKGTYWALPPVIRFNHAEGIAPYSGIVTVTQNSRAVSADELEADLALREVCEECERVAQTLRVTAPIRVDVRRTSDAPMARYAIFDVNMKPNMTGPGRPGRDDQASLTGLSAAAIGWSYGSLLQRILDSAMFLDHLRRVRLK